VSVRRRRTTADLTEGGLVVTLDENNRRAHSAQCWGAGKGRHWPDHPPRYRRLGIRHESAVSNLAYALQNRSHNPLPAVQGRNLHPIKWVRSYRPCLGARKSNGRDFRVAEINCMTCSIFLHALKFTARQIELSWLRRFEYRPDRTRDRAGHKVAVEFPASSIFPSISFYFRTPGGLHPQSSELCGKD
jgi:hypothetical protein